ncbi:hypothetical protein [Aminobacter sp. HY435]|uniref:hypothetical protein n=1 Tax=Aminobacter sp. HY435 TaxID=2970917 RepID=UPI0022B9A730|nr:hypothetical protein [Aminobacter sp. HY435]
MSSMRNVGHLLESEAVEEFDQNQAALVSIAISLKRIADKMEGPTERRTRIRMSNFQWPDGCFGKSGEAYLREAKEHDDKRG